MSVVPIVQVGSMQLFLAGALLAAAAVAPADALDVPNGAHRVLHEL